MNKQSEINRVFLTNPLNKCPSELCQCWLAHEIIPINSKNEQRARNSSSRSAPNNHGIWLLLINVAVVFKSRSRSHQFIRLTVRRIVQLVDSRLSLCGRFACLWLTLVPSGCTTCKPGYDMDDLPIASAGFSAITVNALGLLTG